MQYLTAAAFAVILGALGAAGVYMLRGGEGASKSGRMMKALAVRIGVSIALFVAILLAWAFGWIQPHGLPLGP